MAKAKKKVDFCDQYKVGDKVAIEVVIARVDEDDANTTYAIGSGDDDYDYAWIRNELFEQIIENANPSLKAERIKNQIKELQQVLEAIGV
jgi:hypothetical protein